MKPTASWEGQEDICAKPALTTREREIARLLVARQTNAEIARTLGISLHTVRHHIEHVLQKLGISSRREVAATGRVTDERFRD
jgi:DNA-binding CsgD family transcriptional regulator